MLAYTPAQSAAIAAIDGNLQLIACVGSGKDRDVLAGHPVGPAHQT
jgi:superfamily I DNA/RNA helicase